MFRSWRLVSASIVRVVALLDFLSHLDLSVDHCLLRWLEWMTTVPLGMLLLHQCHRTWEGHSCLPISITLSIASSVSSSFQAQFHCQRRRNLMSRQIHHLQPLSVVHCLQSARTNHVAGLLQSQSLSFSTHSTAKCVISTHSTAKCVILVNCPNRRIWAFVVL